MKILINGRSGQVSRALQRCLKDCGELIVLGRQELDLARTDLIFDTVVALRPDMIINAAAYTAVDRAETDEAMAFAINATAPGILAQAAAALAIPLIQFSTEYVFDGAYEGLYQEDMKTSPLNVYGRSKLEGEKAIQAVGGKYLILRTSWVYSQDGHCFLRSMYKLLQERELLKVVDDQIGSPTWSETIAAATQQIVQRYASTNAGAWGIYHLVATGETSWFSFTQRIAEKLAAQDVKCSKLLPIPSSDYPTPAKRPHNSRMDCSKIKAQWGVTLPGWQEAFNQCWAEHFQTTSSSTKPV